MPKSIREILTDIDDTKNETIRIERNSASGGGGGGIDLHLDVLATIFGVFFGVLGIGWILGKMPMWARFVLLFVVLAVLCFLAVRYFRKLRARFQVAPVRTTLSTVFSLTVLTGMGFLVNSCLRPFDKHYASEFYSKGYSPAIQQSQLDGIVLSQCFAFPNAWTVPITIPAGSKHADWMSKYQVRVRANGTAVPLGQDYEPKPGDSLSFMALGGIPVPTTVRVFLRKPTASELKRPIPFIAEPAAPNR